MVIVNNAKMKFLNKPLIVLAVGLFLVYATSAAPKPENSSENEVLQPVEDLSKENSSQSVAVDPVEIHHDHDNLSENEEQELNGMHRRPHAHRHEHNHTHDQGHRQPEEKPDKNHEANPENNSTVSDLAEELTNAIVPLANAELINEELRPKPKGRLSISCLFCFFECNCDE